MGSVSVFHRSTSSTFSSPPPSVAQPKADDWQVVSEKRFGYACVLELRYGGQPHYEGRKVLVFKATGLAAIVKKNGGLIDPHFDDNPKFISPFARFEPTDEGRRAAEQLAKTL